MKLVQSRLSTPNASLRDLHFWKTGAQRFVTPYQSVGARGVNNLSSALLLSLLPPNSPFFRLVLDKREKDKLRALDPTIETEVESSLAEIERAVAREIEVNNIRVGRHRECTPIPP